MHAWVWKCAVVCTAFVGAGIALLTLAFQLLSNDDIQDQTPTRLQAYVRFQMLLIASWVSFMVALFGGMYWFRHTRSNPHPTAFLALTGTFSFLKGSEWKRMTMFGHHLNGTARNLLYFFYWAGAVAMGGLLVAYMIDDDITSVCMDDYDCFIVSPDAKLPVRANCTVTPSLSPPHYFDCRRLMQFSLQQVGMSIGATYGIFCTTLRVVNAVMFVVGHSSHESTGVKKRSGTAKDEEAGSNSTTAADAKKAEASSEDEVRGFSKGRKRRKRKHAKRRGGVSSKRSAKQARAEQEMRERKHTNAAATPRLCRSTAGSINRGDSDDGAEMTERFGDTREWQTVDNQCFEGNAGDSATTSPITTATAPAAVQRSSAGHTRLQTSSSQSGKSRAANGNGEGRAVHVSATSLVKGRQREGRISSGAWDVSEAEEAEAEADDISSDAVGGKQRTPRSNGRLGNTHVEAADAFTSGEKSQDDSGSSDNSDDSDDSADDDDDDDDDDVDCDGVPKDRGESLGLEWIMFFVVNGLTLGLVVLYLTLGILTDIIEHPGIVGMFFAGLCTMMVLGLTGVGVITVCPCCSRRRRPPAGYTLIADAR